MMNQSVEKKTMMTIDPVNNENQLANWEDDTQIHQSIFELRMDQLGIQWGLIHQSLDTRTSKNEIYI